MRPILKRGCLMMVLWLVACVMLFFAAVIGAVWYGWSTPASTHEGTNYYIVFGPYAVIPLWFIGEVVICVKYVRLNHRNSNWLH